MRRARSATRSRSELGDPKGHGAMRTDLSMRRAVERSCTSTTRSLKPLTLLLVYDGVDEWLRGPELHRRGLAYETELRTRTLPAMIVACRREDLHLHYMASQTTDSANWSTAAKFWWERWDSHPVVLMAAALQAASVSQPSTFPWSRGPRSRAPCVGCSTGLAPAYTRVTASRLDYFGIDHSPP